MQQDSFDALKQVVSTTLVLKVVNLEKPFDVELDANGSITGALLSQDGTPMAFESKKL